MVDRRVPVVSADEGTTLVAFLDYLRESLVLKVQDLSEADARRRLVSSRTTLLGLLRHLTDGEYYWFGDVVGGREMTSSDDDFAVPEGVAVAQVVSAYRTACAASNEVVAAAADLDAVVHVDSRRLTLRWVLVHMIEETGRHAGHADILRELIDGTTGR